MRTADRVDVQIRDRYDPDKRVIVHSSMSMNYRASFAARLIERVALIVENGSKGKAYVRQPSDELARYCCDVADDAFAEFDRRGWLTPVPALPDEEKDE